MSTPKVQTISKYITPFAGIFFANDEFRRSGLRKLIDRQLGIRNSTKGYSYGNLIGNFFNLFLCGGECAEDIQHHLRPTLEQIPGNKVASADTLLRCFSELATDNTIVATPSSDKRYRFNINEPLNDLNIRSLLLTKQLEKDGLYDFDYDNQIIEHEKFDAKKTYKRNFTNESTQTIYFQIRYCSRSICLSWKAMGNATLYRQTLRTTCHIDKSIK